jgi:hypothetical protein
MPKIERHLVVILPSVSILAFGEGRLQSYFKMIGQAREVYIIFLRSITESSGCEECNAESCRQLSLGIPKRVHCVSVKRGLPIVKFLGTYMAEGVIDMPGRRSSEMIVRRIRMVYAQQQIHLSACLPFTSNSQLHGNFTYGF